MEIFADCLLDVLHFLVITLMWLEHEHIVVLDHLSLIFFEGPDSKVAKVFLDVDTTPILEHWDHAREES